MVSQAGFHGPTHSGPDTALSGAGDFGQDDGAAVDSPAPAVATSSQVSAALAGVPSRTHAAHSGLQSRAHLATINSALSIADLAGTWLTSVLKCRLGRLAFAQACS